MAPDYTSEIFHPSHGRQTRVSTYRIGRPFRKSVYGQKTLSYLGPKIWNSLPAQIKLRKNVNTFKHYIKNLFFNKLQKRDDTSLLFAKRSHITFCLLIIFVIELHNWSLTICIQSTFVLCIPQGTIMKIRSIQTRIMSSLPRCIFR